ncbi:SWIM zinc finger domain-containing protein [soil metagenome]
MALSSIEYSYRFPYASSVVDAHGASVLQLATSEQAKQFPYFFEGILLQPRSTAQLLFMLSRVVSTRFYTPPGMLKRILAERDPVITSGGELLRFEGFSACCSTYARVDLSPDAYAGKVVGTGTTNVDFNAAMRAALAAVRDNEKLAICVGPDEVSMKRGFASIVEKKVALPLRWLKGFVEVQSYQSQMEHRYTIGKVEAIRFLRSLPSNSNDRSIFWIVPAGKGLRLSQVDAGSCLKVSGLSRLLLLKHLAPLADELNVYAHPRGESSEWQLRCGGTIFNLTLTAESSRGFSGEGQALSELATVETDQIAKVRSSLKWQSIIRIEEIAKQCELPQDTVRQLLGLLGSRGLVGYDVGAGAFFHRELPFDLELVEELHPRLKGARKLVASGQVKILDNAGPVIEAEVQGSDVKHRVRISGSRQECTCQWHMKYQGSRGPCKHILAVHITTGGDYEE